MNRTPINELELQASPNLRRALKREAPRSHRVSMPRVPEHLSDGEKKAFEQACEVLTEKGILATRDGLVIERYAVMRARWAANIALLQREGETLQVERLDRLGRACVDVIENPRLKVVLALERSLLSLEKALQLTPSRREPDDDGSKRKMNVDETLAFLDANLGRTN